MTTSTPEDAAGLAKQEHEVNLKKRPMTEDSDAEKLAARREANRIHALKSRQRSKALLQELQRTVTQLSGEKAELERENAVMRAQIEVLQQQNLALTQSQRMLLMRSGQLGGAPGAAAMNAFAPGLFGLSQAASMPAAAPTATATTPAAPTTTGAPNSMTTATGTTPNGGAAPAPSAANGDQQQNGLDQAAVAAAAAAMIQGQAAAAAAAAAGFQPQFQQFMAGFNMGGNPARSPAPPTATATPTPAPTPNVTPAPPPQTAVPPPTKAMSTKQELMGALEEVHAPTPLQALPGEAEPVV